MAVEIQLQARRDTAANWTSNDPTLSTGEIGYETDTGFYKWGDGVTAWTSLSYDRFFGGVLSSTKIIAGDPGTEASGIIIGGVTYESVLKASDIGGTNEAQFILHRHSTTLPALIVGARTASNTSAHTIVANNDILFGLMAAGWDGLDSYSQSGQIRFVVDGTPGTNDMPGRIEFLTTPAGSETPILHMSIRESGLVEVIGEGIFIEQTTNGPAIDIDTSSDTGTAIAVFSTGPARLLALTSSAVTTGEVARITGAGVTTGRGLQVSVTNAGMLAGAATADFVVEHASAAGDVLRLQQDGAGKFITGIFDGSEVWYVDADAYISGQGLLLQESIRLIEMTDHIYTPAATFGELWVKDDVPNKLMFTDDAGTDHNLLSSGIQGLGIWKYRTETATPPASGQIRFDNANISIATEFYLHEITDGGTDVAVFLETLLQDGSVLFIQDQTNSANRVLIEISSSVDSGTYRTYGIQSVIEEGTEPGQNTNVILIASSAGGGGSGNVTKVGTPVDMQLGVWTGDGTIEGDPALLFNTASNTLTLGVSGDGGNFTLLGDSPMSKSWFLTGQGADQGIWVDYVSGETKLRRIASDNFINNWVYEQIERSGTGAGVQVDSIFWTVANEIRLSTTLVTLNGELALNSYSEDDDSYTVTVGTKALDTTLATYFHPTGAMTAVAVDFTFDNPAASGRVTSFMLEMSNMIANTDATPWPTSVDWPGGTEPTWTSGIDVAAFWTRDGGTTWHGSAVTLDSQ
jgi:hypothetical protein